MIVKHALVLLAAAALGATPTHTQQQPAQPQTLVLADTALDVRADSLVQGVKVYLSNKGKTAVVITGATLEPLRTRADSARPLTFAPAVLAVAVGDDAAALTVRGAEGWNSARPGRYAATLRLRTAGGVVAAVPFVLKLRAAPGASVRPLVSPYRVRVGGGMPFVRFSGEVWVPVSDSAAPAGVRAVLKNGSAAPVVARSNEVGRWEADTAVHAVRVRLDALRGGGTYTGAVPLAGGDSDAKVDLTVDASDHVLAALLAVGLGVLAGYLLRKWLEVGRLASELRERELRLGARFDVAFARLALAGGNPDPLAQDVRKRREALELEIRGYRWNLTKDDATYESLKTQIEALETAAARAGALAVARGNLAKMIGLAAKAFAGAVPPPAGTGVLETEPRVMVVAQKLLTERGADLDALEADATAWNGEAAFVKTVGDAYHDWVAKTGWLAELRAAQNDDEKTQLDAVAKKLGDVEWAVWDAANEAGFNRLEPETKLTDAEDTMREIAAAQRARPAGSTRLKLGEAADLAAAPPFSREGWSARARLDADLPVHEQTLRADAERFRRGLTNVTAGVLSLVVAVLAMLARDYFGHAWGSVSDYTAALTWGFGTKTGLDLLNFGALSLRPVLTRITTRAG